MSKRFSQHIGRILEMSCQYVLWQVVRTFFPNVGQTFLTCCKHDHMSQDSMSFGGSLGHDTMPTFPTKQVLELCKKGMKIKERLADIPSKRTRYTKMTKLQIIKRNTIHSTTMQYNKYLHKFHPTTKHTMPTPTQCHKTGIHPSWCCHINRQ